MISRGNQPPLRVVHRRYDAETFLLQFPGNAAHAITGDGVSLDVAMHDQNGKFQIFIHGAQCPEAADQSLPITSG
ncbi:hypothetical protein D3C81_1517380 [compost metagenome]